MGLKYPYGYTAQLEDSDNELLTTHDKVLAVVDNGHLMAAGLIDNHTPFRSFGHNSAVGASFEDIWSYGNSHTEISTAAAVYISSSNANDDQDITIVGLDANWAPQTVTQALNGQTKTEVGSSNTWIRIFRIYNNDDSKLLGDVYCFLDDTLTAGVPDTASKVQSMIEVGYGRSMCTRYSIPAGYTGYISTFYASIDAAAAAEVDLMYREFGKVSHIRRIMHIYFSGYQINFPFPLPCEEKSDILVRAKASGGAVSAGFVGWYEAD